MKSLNPQIVAFGLIISAVTGLGDGRDQVTLSSGWRFQLDVSDLGEKESWFSPDVDRSAWTRVRVPQAWDLYDQALWGYEGIGWYAVSISGGPVHPGKFQTLHFGRVNYQTRVWLNGEFLGENTNGWLPFEFNLSGKLKPNSPNVLVLRVDNRPRLEWLPGAKQIEWVQYGGIVQPVLLITTPAVGISDLRIDAFPGGEGAHITCTTSLRNSGAVDQEVLLRLSVAGQRASRSIKLVAKAGNTTVAQTEIDLDRAKAWSPASPFLYTLEATVQSESKTLDRFQSRFGVRKIEVRGREILLNGRPFQVKGVNRYDEYGGYGPNPPQDLVIKDLRTMKDAGVNLVRMHYPQSPDLLALYDEMGFLLIEELPINWWGNGFSGKDGEVQSEDILKQALPALERMIQRDQNHPATVIWSMANESRTDNEIGTKVMRTLLRRAKELDGSRLVTFVTDSSNIKGQRAFEDADLVAINVYLGQFTGEIAEHIGQLEERVHQASVRHIQRQLKSFPDKPMIVTEFGTRGLPGIHGDVPYSEEFQAAFIKSAWTAIRECPELSGGVLWCWADYYHRRDFIQYAAFGPYGVVTVDLRSKAALQALTAVYKQTPAATLAMPR
jgi:beta-galactosidase/beta-glucuronidase